MLVQEGGCCRSVFMVAVEAAEGKVPGMASLGSRILTSRSGAGAGAGSPALGCNVIARDEAAADLTVGGLETKAEAPGPGP